MSFARHCGGMMRVLLDVWHCDAQCALCGEFGLFCVIMTPNLEQVKSPLFFVVLFHGNRKEGGLALCGHAPFFQLW